MGNLLSAFPSGACRTSVGLITSTCAGLTPDQPARHIEETAIIKGREFPLRLRNDERTADRGGWGTHSAPGVRHPEEKPASVLEGKPNERPLWAAFAAVNG